MGQIILGVDPGTLNTGFGVINEEGGEAHLLDFGVLELQGQIPMAKRLWLMGQKLKDLMIKHKPKAFVLEKTFFAKNADSAMKLGQARGVCLYEAQAAGLSIFEYNPTEVKKGLTGSGRAEKDQVRIMIRTILNLNEKQMGMMTKLDMSDALALAVYHGRRAATMDLMRQAESRA